MLRYALNRLLLMLPTLVATAALIFFVLRVIPGDIVEIKLTADGGAVSQAVLQAERHRLGLDRPLVVQFGTWMEGLATLDLGRSMWTGRPVAEEIAVRLSLSLQVALMATIVALLIAVPLGTLSALFPNSLLDYAIRVVSIAGLAVPPFWLGMLIILALLASFNWMPPSSYTPFFRDPLANIAQLIWPALAVGYRLAAVVTRMVRSSVLEVMKEDYIRTARAKGVPERRVVTRHALRNALLPALTVVGLEFAFLIGGLVVTELVFNLNGIGHLLIDAVGHSDFVLVQGIVMLLATLFIAINLAIDLLYSALDPRIRYRP
jgi:peptide/nickel transport system permease protein